MALTAARSDLTISLAGEDQTSAMLDQARNQMAALEARLKSLKAAGDTQAATAGKQVSALGRVNTGLVGVARSAEGLVEGFDKTKAATDKLLGVAGFLGPVFGTIATGAVLALDAITGLSGGLSAQEEAFWRSTQAARQYTADLKAVEESAKAALKAANEAITENARLGVELAKTTGDKSAVAAAESALAYEEATDKRLAAGARFVEAQKQEAAQELEAARISQELTKQRDALELVEKQIADRRARRVLDEDDILLTQRAVLAGLVDDLDFAQERALNKLDALARQTSAMEELVVRTEALDQARAEAPAKPEEKPKPRGGGGARRPERDMVAEAQREIDAIMGELESMAVEWEFEGDLIAEEQKMLERQRKRAEAAKQAAKDAKEAADEAAMLRRESDTEGIYSFIGALGQLVPELGAVEQAMQRVTAVFDMFRDGQVSFADAVAASATEVAASVARSVGGVKAEAAVRSAYHLAMGFGTLATPWISAGHFTAAAMLAGVATGVIKTGGGGAPAGGGMGRPAQAQASSSGANIGGGNTTVNNYTLRAGVVDGQSTTRAFRRAELASRNTGFAHAGGW